jgi:hypothetical protein
MTINDDNQSFGSNEKKRQSRHSPNAQSIFEAQN